MGACTYDRVPHHLRRYVLVQDESRYDEVDQQVWRYILRRIFARLKQSAHFAYATGLEKTGISIDRIPSIVEMDRRLADFGWGAVCVDGFLPPRAFQEFQALGILPINAEIRTPEHILYTPAPDIVHEAAGHAPILPEPRYAEYLGRIGRIGSRAFASPADARVYQAIYDLSEIKESPCATPVDIARCEQALADALASVGRTSEAAKLSRLYWWTAEYGLVGQVDDYKLYGAGLLSSLGESESCHDPAVRKVPLSAACVETDYDITREQPQLFVARDFDHLHEVLDEVAATLAHRVGRERALSVAAQSGEVGTLELDSGIQVTGRIDAVEREGSDVALVRLVGRTGIGIGGTLCKGHGGDDHPDGLAIPLGPLVDGRLASGLCSPSELASAPGGPLTVTFRSGVTVHGTYAGEDRHRDGRLAVVHVRGGGLTWGERTIFAPADPRETWCWVVGSWVATAHAGAADPAYWPPTEHPSTRVPAPRPPRSALVGLDRPPTIPPIPGRRSALR